MKTIISDISWKSEIPSCVGSVTQAPPCSNTKLVSPLCFWLMQMQNYCFQVTDVGVPVARGVILALSVSPALDRDSGRNTWENSPVTLGAKELIPLISNEAFLLRVNLLSLYSKPTPASKTPLLFKAPAVQGTSDSILWDFMECITKSA